MKPRIAILFLAAGASRRMGRAKALLPWNGETIVAHHAALIAAIENCEAWIVTQFDDPALFTELQRIEWPRERQVINPDAPDCDMAASIRCGIRAALKAGADAIGIALIDQPLIQRETIEALLAAWRLHPDRIWQPEHRGRHGHPVVLPRKFATALGQEAKGTLRDFLTKNEASRNYLPVDDDGITTDLDTPREYEVHLSRQAMKGATHE